MAPALRKLILTTHISTSVGWLGAVVAYIPLDVIAATSENVQLVRAAYLGMELTIWFAIVPLALASVLVGIVNSLSTPWGLFRHYWVLVKLLLTIFITIILLLEAQAISYMAEMAAGGATDPRELPGSLFHSIGALLFLLAIAVLSVYRPRGLTRYGWRKQQEQRAAMEKM